MKFSPSILGGFTPLFLVQHPYRNNDEQWIVHHFGCGNRLFGEGMLKDGHDSLNLNWKLGSKKSFGPWQVGDLQTPGAKHSSEAKKDLGAAVIDYKVNQQL